MQTFALCKAAQVSATLTALIMVCYWVTEDPDPVLYVMASGDDAATLSSTRLMPMMEESPSVAEQFTADRFDKTTMEYTLRQTVLRFIGSHSPSKTASYPHRYVVADEVDKWKETVGREGSTLGLVFARARQFWNRKRIVLSTPTVESATIWQQYLLGDQRRYFVPCPHCTYMQPLEWSQVRFDDMLPPADAGAGAHYECAACKGHITDGQKHWMVARGEWRATATPRVRHHASAHLSSLYSNSDECSFGALVEKFLAVKDNPAMLQEFVNQDLAEPWREPPKMSVTAKFVRERRDAVPYPRGTVPTEDGFVAAMTVDVQAAHFVYAVWAMQLHRQWLVDNGIVPTWEELDEVFNGEYHSGADSKPFRCERMFLDTGYRTMQAYEYALSRPAVVPIKGTTGAGHRQSRPVSTSAIDSYPGGRMFGGGRSLVLVHVHPSYFKDQLAQSIAGTSKVAIFFHADISQDYIRQLGNEVLRESKPDKSGNTTLYWEKIGRNDDFDTAQYGFAARHVLAGRIAQAHAAPKPKRTLREPYIEVQKGWIDGTVRKPT